MGSKTKKIAVVGCGHVGGPLAAVLTSLGHDVWGVDMSESVVAAFNKGQPLFEEPGLVSLLRVGLAEKRLRFVQSSQRAEAVKGAEVVFFCLPTPPMDSGEADTSYLVNEIREVVPLLDGYTVLVEKSTAPAGTALAMQAAAQELKLDNEKDWDIAVSPEFMVEGRALDTLLRPDRLVIGTASPRADAILTDIYKPLHAPILHTDLVTAELIKHGSNTMLGLRVAFANTIAELAEETGADGLLALKGIGLDRRIGHQYLSPGLIGGFCIPKDSMAFAWLLRSKGVASTLIDQIMGINERMLQRVISKVEKAVGGLSGKTITVLGLSFKPGTSDVRFSPALDLIKSFLELGATIKAYDPAVRKSSVDRELGKDRIEVCEDPYVALDKADAAVIATDWPQFKGLELPTVKESMKAPIIVDVRNVFVAERMKDLGFHYDGLGQPTL